MSPPPSSAAAPFVPLRLDGRSPAMKVLAVLIGTALLAAASRIEVPMVPVPMTMQTYAVVLVGALYGCRLGTLTVLAWLGQAMIGLPVLAGGAAGIGHFFGPTAGYLVAFPIAAALVGLLADRGWTAGRPLAAVAAMLLGHALCLGLGTAWLATQIGGGPAVTHGLAPFLIGAGLKSALAAATVEAARRLSPASGPGARPDGER